METIRVWPKAIFTLILSDYLRRSIDAAIADAAHLIFSTKNRSPLLDEKTRPRVHAYLATVIRDLSSPWVVVGGVADHVHALFDQ